MDFSFLIPTLQSIVLATIGIAASWILRKFNLLKHEKEVLSVVENIVTDIFENDTMLIPKNEKGSLPNNQKRRIYNRVRSSIKTGLTLKNLEIPDDDKLEVFIEGKYNQLKKSKFL